jgi:AcrR family transcriptional regulator
VEETPSTRDRILAAAVAEFAARGFAGARMDRIAAAANANKERIYAYFGDKEALFREVLKSSAADAFSWLPESGRDLPRAAGDLFDAAFANPDLLRLTAWRRLEHTGASSEQEHADIARKIRDISKAQEDGRIDASWDPADVLAMIAALGAMWANAPAALAAAVQPERGSVRDRRDVVEEALRRIISPNGRRPTTSDPV